MIRLHSLFCIERCRGCHAFVVDEPADLHPPPFFLRTLCRQCRSKIDVGAPLVEALPLTDGGSLIVASAVPYSGLLKKLVYRLKYDADELVAEDLGDLVAAVWEQVASGSLLPDPAPMPESTMLVPVPLNFWRRFKRGFNQAELIAVKLSRRHKLKLMPSAMSRRKMTSAHHDLGRAERYQNIQAAFTASSKVRGASVVLVDDIYTSGATLSECARTLMGAGAARVFAITAARATLDHADVLDVTIPIRDNR
jgi:ComF family protein